jgi:hypothetical protein
LLTFLDNIAGTEDVAYADDILNFSTELAGVQLKADQISAMCAFTGLEISYKKISSLCEDGKPVPPDPESPRGVLSGPVTASTMQGSPVISLATDPPDGATKARLGQRSSAPLPRLN